MNATAGVMRVFSDTPAKTSLSSLAVRYLGFDEAEEKVGRSKVITRVIQLQKLRAGQERTGWRPSDGEPASSLSCFLFTRMFNDLDSGKKKKKGCVGGTCVDSCAKCH